MLTKSWATISEHGVPSMRELEALVQVGLVVADGQHPRALGRVAQHLGHEGHLGAEGLRELARQRAEEGLAGHRRRPRRDRVQQVAAAAGRVVGTGVGSERGQEAMLTPPPAPSLSPRPRAAPAVRHATYGGRAASGRDRASAVRLARGEHARQVVDRGVARGHRGQAEAVLDRRHDRRRVVLRRGRRRSRRAGPARARAPGCACSGPCCRARPASRPGRAARRGPTGRRTRRRSRRPSCPWRSGCSGSRSAGRPGGCCRCVTLA